MENSENQENEDNNENEEKLRGFADSNYFKIEENSDSSSEKKRAKSFPKIRENPSFVKSN